MLPNVVILEKWTLHWKGELWPWLKGPTAFCEPLIIPNTAKDDGESSITTERSGSRRDMGRIIAGYIGSECPATIEKLSLGPHSSFESLNDMNPLI